MCTSTISQIILDALEVCINNERVFTAFDVTIEARNKTKDAIFHRDVRRIVQKEFENNQFPRKYVRESIELDALDNPYAMVYYPIGKEANDHPKALIHNFPTLALNQVAPNAALNKDYKGGNVKDGDGYICRATIEGRINVPKELISQIGNNGGSYDFIVNGGTMTLYKQPNTDGRIRIPIIELGGGNKFRFEVDTATNVIKIETM